MVILYRIRIEVLRGKNDTSIIVKYMIALFFPVGEMPVTIDCFVKDKIYLNSIFTCNIKLNKHCRIKIGDDAAARGSRFRRGNHYESFKVCLVSGFHLREEIVLILLRIYIELNVFLT